jgi:hypothetical protein
MTVLHSVEAPFNSEQVAHINEFQREGYMHPFTCPGAHSGERNLVATKDGLHCPSCDYRQFWVHSFMADGAAVANYRRMFASRIAARQLDANGDRQ